MKHLSSRFPDAALKLVARIAAGRSAAVVLFILLVVAGNGGELAVCLSGPEKAAPRNGDAPPAVQAVPSPGRH